jgi:hypothetical protein
MFIYRIQVFEEDQPVSKSWLEILQKMVENPKAHDLNRKSFDLHKMLWGLAVSRDAMSDFADALTDNQLGKSEGKRASESRNHYEEVCGLFPPDWTYPDSTWKTDTGWTFLSRKYGEWKHILMLSDCYSWYVNDVMGGGLPDFKFHVYYSDTTLDYFGKIVIERGKIVDLFLSHKDLNPTNKSQWEPFPMHVWDDTI